MPTDKAKQQVNLEIKSLDKVAEEQRQVEDLKRPQAQANDADTRQKIARQFVTIYFVILALIVVGAPTYNLIAFKVTGGNNLQIKLGDIMQTYAAVVGPTLGFVIGYYFKSKND